MCALGGSSLCSSFIGKSWKQRGEKDPKGTETFATREIVGPGVSTAGHGNETKGRPSVGCANGPSPESSLTRPAILFVRWFFVTIGKPAEWSFWFPLEQA